MNELSIDRTEGPFVARLSFSLLSMASYSKPVSTRMARPDLISVTVEPPPMPRSYLNR